MTPRKILFIVGTRPEAIKMALLIRKVRASKRFRTLVCVTGQHRAMLDQVLKHFDISTDYDFDLMKKGQDIFDLTTGILFPLKELLKKEKPDLVLVQGDTTTAFVGCLAAFYMQIPVGHIEAGLRTYNNDSPFPEEVNRRAIGTMATYHFAPTALAGQNLLEEKIDPDRIWITGNTVIDALIQESKSEENDGWETYFKERWAIATASSKKKIILVTGHRRESFGEGFKNICLALKRIAQMHPECNIVYPVHLNPNVRDTVLSILGAKENSLENVYLIDPLDYPAFVHLLKNAHIVLTDSGGIQEEAPSLGKPVLVMRKATERKEGVDAGTCILVGTNADSIVHETHRLLLDTTAYNEMAQKKNPYGDGKASDIILSVLEELFE